MKIETIEQPEPLHMRDVHGFKRCEEKISTSGTATMPGRKRACRRFPSFLIGGERLCKLHAGDKALKYLLDK